MGVPLPGVAGSNHGRTGVCYLGNRTPQSVPDSISGNVTNATAAAVVVVQLSGVCMKPSLELMTSSLEAAAATAEAATVSNQLSIRTCFGFLLFFL